MRFRRIFPAAFFAPTALPTTAQDVTPMGIWTSTEGNYFAKEEGLAECDRVAPESAKDDRWRRKDPIGRAFNDWLDAPVPQLSRRDGRGWQVGTSKLRISQPLSCCISARNFAAGPGDNEDSAFAENLETIDQGGQVFVDGEFIAPDLSIRVRNVTWTKGNRSRPALALYVRKLDPLRAESCSWSSSDTGLIGINLRSVKTSCSRKKEIDDANNASHFP